MSELTPKQVEDYVAKGGNTCPKCGSSDIETGSMEVDTGAAWQAVECLSCGLSWQDSYRLVGIIEDSE